MSEGEKFVKEMDIFLNGWEFGFVDAKGKSGGLILGWHSQSMKLINPCAFELGIGVTLHYT